MRPREHKELGLISRRPAGKPARFEEIRSESMTVTTEDTRAICGDCETEFVTVEEAEFHVENSPYCRGPVVEID